MIDETTPEEGAAIVAALLRRQADTRRGFDDSVDPHRLTNGATREARRVRSEAVHWYGAGRRAPHPSEVRR